MMQQPDLEKTIDAIAGLQRLAVTETDESARHDLESAAELLEELAGRTVSRVRAAELLGVSHTALNRWVRKGEVAAVLTPAGRYEVPLRELLELRQAVSQHRDKNGSLALAEVMRDRRRRAAQIPEDDLLPPRLRRNAQSHGHRNAELRALAYHRAVARRLDKQLVAAACRTLRRWREGGQIHPEPAQKWQAILEKPVPSIAKFIRSDTQLARDLRQSSPFAGLITEQERRRALEAAGGGR